MLGTGSGLLYNVNPRLCNNVNIIIIQVPCAQIEVHIIYHGFVMTYIMLLAPAYVRIRELTSALVAKSKLF